MKNWFVAEIVQKWSYRLQQLFILIAHLLLLKWILYTLGESGTMPTVHVLLHFLGMGLYGAALIRGTAFWAQYHYKKELEEYESQKNKNSNDSNE